MLLSYAAHARGQIFKMCVWCVRACVDQVGYWTKIIVCIWFVLWILTVEMQLIPTGGGLQIQNYNQVDERNAFGLGCKINKAKIHVCRCLCANWHWGRCGLKLKLQTFNYNLFATFQMLCPSDRCALLHRTNIKEIYLKFWPEVWRR